MALLVTYDLKNYVTGTLQQEEGPRQRACTSMPTPL